MTYKQTTTESKTKTGMTKVVHDITDETPEEVDETSPRFEMGVTFNLSNMEFLRVTAHRSGNDREQLAEEIANDVIAMKNWFVKKNKEIMT